MSDNLVAPSNSQLLHKQSAMAYCGLTMPNEAICWYDFRYYGQHIAGPFEGDKKFARDTCCLLKGVEVT